jgi:hypothetical protein
MRARSLLIFGTVLAIGFAMFGSASAVTDRHAAAPAASNLHGWTRLSSGAVPFIDSLSVARFGQQLQAVWRVDAGVSEDLRSRIVSVTGKTVGGQLDPLPGTWGTLNDYPVIFADGGKRLIGFSGIQNTTTSNPYSQGYQYVLDGGSLGTNWSLTGNTLTNSAAPYGSNGTDITSVGGTPLTAYTSGLTSNTVRFRLGQPQPIPEVSSSDSHAFIDSHCCTYNTGVGYDATHHQAWTVWYENTGRPDTDGLDAQQIEPSVGTSHIHAPGSTQRSNGTYASVQLDHRIKVAQRVGGGLFAAYVEGYPSANKVALWRVGASKAMVRKVGPAIGTDVQAIGSAAGIKGRVWMYWWVNGTNKIEVARTSPNASHIGSTCSIKLPAGVTEVADMVGNATNGPLSLFIDAGSSTGAVYSKVIGGCFGVSVSPHKLSHTKKGKVHVFVTDAGAPVKGAKVHFRGKTRTTSSSGRVTFKVAKGAKKGKYKVTVTGSGFIPATRFVRIV